MPVRDPTAKREHRRTRASGKGGAAVGDQAASATTADSVSVVIDTAAGEAGLAGPPCAPEPEVAVGLDTDEHHDVADFIGLAGFGPEEQVAWLEAPGDLNFGFPGSSPPESGRAREVVGLGFRVSREHHPHPLEKMLNRGRAVHARGAGTAEAIGDPLPSDALAMLEETGDRVSKGSD